MADVLAQVASLPISEITISLIQQKLSEFFQEMFDTFTERQVVEWTKKVRWQAAASTHAVAPQGAGPGRTGIPRGLGWVALCQQAEGRAGRKPRPHTALPRRARLEPLSTDVKPGLTGPRTGECSCSGERGGEPAGGEGQEAGAEAQDGGAGARPGDGNRGQGPAQPPSWAGSRLPGQINGATWGAGKAGR